jgi:hypothetical protein
MVRMWSSELLRCKGEVQCRCDANGNHSTEVV